MSIFDGVEGLSEELKTQMQAKIDESFVAKSDFDAVRRKTDELLGETKKAKELARLAEQEKTDAQRAKAEKEGDVESLKKFYELERKKLADELDGIKQTSKRQKISAISGAFVKDKFVDDDVIVEAISNKFAKRLDIREDKVIVLDAEGNITGLSVDDLQNEFLNSQAYKKHIVSSRATGGGANGSGSGSGAVKTMARAAFDRMNAVDKSEFIKTGGKVT